jgi:hypothetical protein
MGGHFADPIRPKIYATSHSYGPAIRMRFFPYTYEQYAYYVVVL